MRLAALLSGGKDPNETSPSEQREQGDSEAKLKEFRSELSERGRL